MNCKQGDLAIVIGQECPSSIPLGSLVRCLSFESATHWEEASGPGVPVRDVWHVEWRGTTHGSLARWGIRDCHLRPIGNPGEHEVDQMVKLLGAPEERTPVLVGQGVEA